MIKSINQPWAISEKHCSRYGELWTKLDFIFENKISEENFKTDPMNTVIGTLYCSGLQITMRYKDLISYSKSLEIYTHNMYADRVTKTDVMMISVKGREFALRRHEVAKLSETISEALDTSMRAYELGLYL